MKVKGSGSARYIEITAKNNYTQEELLELLQTQGNFPVGAPVMSKLLGVQLIDFPGEDGYTNSVTAKKNKITISQSKRSAKGIGKSLFLDTLTSGWSRLLNAEGKKNEAVMDAIGQEIERLVG
ncbi:MAG: hypothetical protein LBT19_01410 [Candidatus Nomurabacteria bacterium]|jgi:hypothetical protein|nr:hypothetical protein [Candidatus Nomurabacteria bacterium]